MLRRLPWLALVLAALAAPGLPAQGDPEAQVRLRPIPEGVERPRIDAFLSDPAWDSAVDIGPLRQVVPVEGAEPSLNTRVRLAYDARSVFMAVECFDPEPALIRDTQRRRDAELNPDDRVEFLFDTFCDRRNCYWFQIGAGGSRGDALVTRNGSRFNKQWDGIWYGRARVTPEGWVAEVEIPLATMNFSPETDRWGFDLRRHIRRRNEEARWATPQQRRSFFAVVNAGTLTGIEGLEQGLGLTVAPFAVVDASRRGRDRSAGVRERALTTGDVGADAFYNLNPSFKLSVSLNTDFAETEVDERRVNLTRFPLFFPEQRDFFLEDSGTFFFGSGRDATRPFFSRRIGIDGNGEEVPLHAALKLTGRSDRFTVGLLDVQTGREGDLDARNLFVGRVSMNVLEQSDVGLIYTRGHPTADQRNDSYGVDFNYRTADFLGGRNLDFSATVLRADGADIERDEMAYFVGAGFPNDQLDLRGSVSVVEKEFRPALGFVPRRGIKQYDLDLGFNPRLHSWIRQLRLGVFPTLVTGMANDLESSQVRVRPLGAELETGDEFGLSVTRVTEVLQRDFPIQSDVVVPVDRYDETRYSAEFETASARVLELGGGLSFGGFFGGERTDWEAAATLRPGGWGNFGLEYELNQVRLPGGDFNVRIWRARVNFQFSPDLSWSNFVQYDSVSDFAGLNSRLHWIVEPGQDLFLVLNQGWDYRVGEIAPQSTQWTTKFSYTFRY